MEWLFKFAKSTVGAKVVMALTGLALVGFVLAHMAGNLQVLIALWDPAAAQEALNSYAAGLKSLGALLWVMRIGLLVAVVVHILSALRLAALNRAARPVSYQVKKHNASTLASRTMTLSGLLVLAFIVYHLLHFTLGVTHPEHFALVDRMGRHDVYSMFVLGLSQPAVAVSYIIANILVGLHLSHGVRSLFQSLGLRTPKYETMIVGLARGVATIVVIANVSMPLLVLVGLIPEA